jgi:hypothetical protein
MLRLPEKRKQAMKVEVKTGSGIPVFLIVVLLVVAGGLGMYSHSLKGKLSLKEAENAKLSGNITALADSFQTYTLEVKHKNKETERVIAAKTYRLSIDRDEWKSRYKEEAETIEALKIKTKNLESIISIQIVASDSISVTSTFIDPLKNVDSLKFETDYMKASVALDKKNISDSRLFYKYYPDLLLTTSFEQKSALWGLIKWGKKFKSAAIVSKDVNCRIDEFEYKEIMN